MNFIFEKLYNKFGYLPDREILTGIGSVPVKMPKVRSRAGKPVTIKRNE